MNSPFDTSGFTFGLEFKSLGFPDIYKTTEFVGFDASSFVVKQDDGRFGRDVSFGNEDTDFEFYDINVERDIEQVQEPNGRVSIYLDMGLKWILETDERFGYEGEVYFHLFKEGIQFTVGRLDFAIRETDGFSYFKCKILQNNQIELYKKNLDTSINLFSTKGFLDQNITPVPTLKVLRRAVPITRKSKWVQKTAKTSTYGLENYFNYLTQIEESEIKNTLTPFFQIGPGSFAESMTNFRYLFAVNKLKYLKLTLNINAIIKYRWDSGHGDTTGAILTLRGVVSSHPFTGTRSDTFTIYTKSFTGTDDVDFTIPTNLQYDIPDIAIGKSFYLQWDWNGSDGALFGATRIEIANSQLEIVASEIALDAVINMVRYIDVLKQCSKFYNNLPVNAPEFDALGQHFNNACWNRALISMQTSNSIELTSITDPNGELGQVVNNINSNSGLSLGLYFWDGSHWIALNDTSISDLFLTTETTPSGTLGELINNTNSDITPLGLCYWNGTSWQGLEYTRPFITNFYDAFGKSMTIETCADYELKNDEIYLGEYPYYYTNNEIAVFSIIPSKEFTKSNNERFLFNNIKIGFNTYETNRLTNNSAKDIFTKAEWSNPSQFVQNKFEREIKYIRSGLSAQAMADLDNNKPQTADSNDDKVFINTIVELPSETAFDETVNLLMQVDSNGNVRILNKSLNQSDSDIVINWLNIGIKIGQTFSILSGQNIGDYTVSAITISTLTLVPIGFTPTYTGDANIRIKFFYIDILWQTETNQRVNVISGLDNSGKYPNLYYSLRRIFENWKPYFASANLFRQDKKIRNLMFINNPPLKSQVGSNPILTEKGDILVSELGVPIVTSNKYVLTTSAEYSEIITLLNNIKTVRGFVRCYNSNADLIITGFIQQLKYTWATKILELTLEERYEPKTIVITNVDGVLSVNDVIYGLSGTLNWWKITGDYFQCFDVNNIPVSKIRRYDEVSYNGVIYNTISDLINALNS